MLRVISWQEEAEKRSEWSGILFHRSSMNSFAMAFFLTSLFAKCALF